MRRLAVATGLVLALVSLASAQDGAFPRNPRIEIIYAAPSNEQFRATYDRMRQLRVLETLQEFLVPLKLPGTIVVKFDQCGGAMTVPYRRNQPVIVCYEQLKAIYDYSPLEGVVLFGQGRQLTRSQALIGAVVQSMLHQFAFAAFDVLQIPIWGRLDDAADSVTGFIMLEFGDEVAWATLLGSAWFLAQRGMSGVGFFSEAVRTSEAQRFYSYLCYAYGARPNTYAFLVNSFNLPEDRARYCYRDYLSLRAAFRKTFMPHIDQNLLARVRARKWLPL